jgi:CDGSH-type Zn-finger protein
MVEGEVEVFAEDGTLITKEARIWLCRCGQSAKKPFCDGAHSGAGFADAALVPADYAIRKPEPGTPTAKLRLTLRAHGPVHCYGQATILGEDGSAWRGSQANLCRCGRSTNKPFCDGTHRDSGWRA